MSATPTFVASYSTSYITSGPGSKTLSITTQAGDVLVVYGGGENEDMVISSLSGNGVTFTPYQSVVTAGYATAYIWSGVDNTGGTNWTLSCSTSGNAQWGFTCLVFRNSQGLGASAQTNGTGAPSLTFTPAASNSALVVFNSDWNAQDGTSRIWRTVNGVAPTSGNGYETNYTYSGGAWTAYGAYYPNSGTASPITVGLSSPGGQWYSLVAIEVKGPPTEKVQALTENFNGGTLNTGKWALYNGANTISQTGGELVVNISTTSGTSSHISSTQTYDLTGSSVTVGVPQFANPYDGVKQYLEVYLDDDNWISLGVGGTYYGLFSETGGIGSDTYVDPYPANDRWWRIRESGGTIYWESSPDRSSWTVLHSATSTFVPTNISVYLIAGSWQDLASPGTAKFDNLNLLPDIRRNTAEGQTNGTTLTAANSGSGSGTAFDSISTTGTASATFSTDVAAFGSQSYKIATSTSSEFICVANVSLDYSGTCQMYLYLPSYPSAEQTFASIVNTGGTAIASLSIDNSGAIRVRNAAGTALSTSSNGIFPTATWMRLDLSATVGISTSTGLVKAQVSSANFTTGVWSYNSGYTTNTGTTTIASHRFGKIGTTATISGTFYIDDTAWRSNVIDFIPPQSVSPGVAWFVA